MLEPLLGWVRAQFPQLACLQDGSPRVYLDNAAGTLVPESVAETMARAAVFSNPQPRRSWPPGPETAALHARVRQEVRDFLNAPPGGAVWLSESTTASLYKLREALEPAWSDRTPLAVTDCDHFANISPWEWRARWPVRRIRMLTDGGLDLDDLAVQARGAAVVAVTAASNGLGTVIPLLPAVRGIREVSPDAVVVVDAVHAAPHLPLDLTELAEAGGVDALAFSAYKLFGPNAGVLWVSERLRRRMLPYRVEPHTDEETVLEWGTLSNTNAAGISACLEYLRRVGERLEPGSVGRHPALPRARRRYRLAMEAIRDYEAGLSGRILEGLRATPGVRLFGVTDPDRAAERVPTFAFQCPGVPDEEVERRLWEGGRVQVAAGNHYSGAILRGLGLPGLVRASFAHYSTPDEAEVFLDALSGLVPR